MNIHTTVTSADLDDTNADAFRAEYDALKSARVAEATIPASLASVTDTIAPVANPLAAVKRAERFATDESARVARLAREAMADATYAATADIRAESALINSTYRDARDAFVADIDANVASIWQVVTARVTSSRFRNRTRSIATVCALQSYCRPSDVPNTVAMELDRIINDATVTAVERLTSMITDESIDLVPLCVGRCVHAECIDTYRAGYGAITVDGVDVCGFIRPLTRRCGECVKCLAKRAGCTAPTVTFQYVTPVMVIGASMNGAARAVFKADETEGNPWYSAGKATRVDVESTDALNVPAARSGATDNVPAEIWRLLSQVVEACESAQEPITASRGVAAFAADALAVARGYAPSVEGRRSMRKDLTRIVAEHRTRVAG